MTRWAAPLACLVVLGSPVATQSPLDRDIHARIRQEAAARSEIMGTLQVLTDVYGPRLTGSPRTKSAADWAVRRMSEWGLENGRLEPWDFGHPGWVNERVSAHMVSPVTDQVTVEVLAWSPGTNGPVRAPAIVLPLPDRPTASDLSTHLDRVRSTIKGKIVLAGRPSVVPVTLTDRPTRQDESRLRTRYGLEGGAPVAERRGAGGARPPRPPLSSAEISRRVDEFLVSNGALIRVNDAGRELGQIVAFNNPSFDATKVVPTVVMRNEDYGRIARILGGGTVVELEFEIFNRLHEDGRTAYNAVAEIAGSDKRREVVMVGGHLDSWHSATGATDNAIGCAVVMEAARILTALDVRPRRTIRVALWSGEEQGLLGSQAYIRDHFGSFEYPKPEHATLSAYLNLDSGTGRVRGALVFGPPAAAAAVRGILAPLSDLGVVGAASTDRRALGSTDSSSFSAAGLPNLNFDQDPIQYDTATHHTNLDTYERIVEDDVRASAIVVATTLYQLAMRDEPLPRFDAKTMPRGTWR